MYLIIMGFTCFKVHVHCIAFVALYIRSIDTTCGVLLQIPTSAKQQMLLVHCRVIKHLHQVVLK